MTEETHEWIAVRFNVVSSGRKGPDGKFLPHEESLKKALEAGPLALIDEEEYLIPQMTAERRAYIKEHAIKISLDKGWAISEANVELGQEAESIPVVIAHALFTNSRAVEYHMLFSEYLLQKPPF